VKEAAPLYEKYYYKFDGWTARFPKRNVRGQVLQGQQIWPDALMLKSKFYNEFLKRFDACEIACVGVAHSEQALEVLSIYRGPREAVFGREQLALLQRLSPHLQIALLTRRRLLALESRMTGLETAFDRLTTAVILINAVGKLVLVNQWARDILEHQDGLRIDRTGLTARSISENTQLHAMIQRAIATPTNGCTTAAQALLITREKKRPLHVFAAPLPPQSGMLSFSAVAAIFIDDPDRAATTDGDVLRELYGLTRAEARLAAILLHGLSLAEATEKLKVSKETVRSQLRAIMSKTRTRRQGELISLLSKFPLDIRLDEEVNPKARNTSSKTATSCSSNSTSSPSIQPRAAAALRAISP
jgi:DNA-binding CsgD family transcriptional regulator